MSSDLEPIRHALSLARERGFAEVVVESGDLKFRAALEPATKKKAPQPVTVGGSALAEEADGPQFHEIVSPMVGYFRVSDPEVAVGDTVTAGQVVGVVASLGDIPYGIESSVEGEVVAFLVEPGQPVMYGQALVQVKP